MISALKSRCLRAFQTIIILTVRPYVVRELRGWGKVYAFVGDYRRDWLWAKAPVKAMHEKLHGRLMHLDLSKWSDRSAYFLGRWYDLATQLLISDLIKPGDSVVDIGANRGMFAFVAAHLVGASGKVICFEPNPQCLRILDQEIAANQIVNVVLHRFGLGDRDEEMTLSVPVFNLGEGTFGKAAYGESSTYQVRSLVKTGDQVLADEKPALIKIDVEGFECKAIAGLARTISQYHPIILTEVVSRHLAACGSSVAELVGLMEGFGYRGFGLGLGKDGARYTWRLMRFEGQSHAPDVVWFHPTALRRHAAILKYQIADA
jgi:FkbM family methyltransferase